MVPPQRDDPFPHFARARAEQPVAFSPALNAWLVTRYEDIHAIVQDPVRFSSALSLPDPMDSPPEVLEILAEGPGWAKDIWILAADPPHHQVIRRIWNRFYGGRQVNALVPRMREIADELIDGFADDGRADLVAQFAHPFVLRTIATIVGVPLADVDRVYAGAESLNIVSPVATLEQKCAAARVMIDVQQYFLDLAEQRRADPRDDMISDLVRIDDVPGTPLSPAQVVLVAWMSFASGQDTSRHAISGALLNLLTDRRRWERARAEPDAIPRMFEESLRRESPHRGLYRFATEDVEVGGVALPAGALLYLLFGSANRDEEQFPEPDAFAPGRDNLRSHLAFGAGIHHCIGAHIARTEGRTALEALTHRLPGLRLVEGYAPIYQPHIFFHGLERLDVVW